MFRTGLGTWAEFCASGDGAEADGGRTAGADAATPGLDVPLGPTGATLVKFDAAGFALACVEGASAAAGSAGLAPGTKVEVDTGLLLNRSVLAGFCAAAARIVGAGAAVGTGVGVGAVLGVAATPV